jgi:hypothetical protein
VGAAVRDATGPVAALSVPVPATRFHGSERRYADALLRAAADATELLGGDPWHRPSRGPDAPPPGRARQLEGRKRSSPASSARATPSR